MSIEHPGGQRLAQVDNLKTVLVAWVIGGHALLGYSAIGGWPYDEVNEVTFAPWVERVLTTMLGPSGLFVIGTFFFVAGLFAPESLARKGAREFLRDRVVRLGLPWAASALLVWPLSLWLAYRSAGHDVSLWWVFSHRDPLLDSGSLWFALVLLVFSAAYVAWDRAAVPVPGRPGAPGAGLLVVVAVVITLATFVVRLWFPARSGQVGDLHLWQWPQCMAMFCLGVVLARHGWARHVPERLWRGSAFVAMLTVGLLAILAIGVGAGDLADDVGPFLGGWRWPALGTAAVEGVLVVAGSVWLLGLAERRLTRHGRLATACARGAFLAFALQGPVLVLLAVAVRPVAAPAEVKAVLVGAMGIAGCFWLGYRLTIRSRAGSPTRR